MLTSILSLAQPTPLELTFTASHVVATLVLPAY